MAFIPFQNSLLVLFDIILTERLLKLPNQQIATTCYFA